MTEAEIRQMLYDKGYEEYQLLPIRIGNKTIGIYAMEKEDIQNMQSSLVMKPQKQYYTDDGKLMLQSFNGGCY